MKEYRLAVISSIVVGVCCGILLAVILLFMMLQNNFVLFNMSFWISLIVVVAIPFCLLVVKRFGLSYFIVCMCMLGVSFLVSIIYASIVGKSSSQYFADTHVFQDIMIMTLIYHALLLIISLIVHYKTRLHVDD